MSCRAAHSSKSTDAGQPRFAGCCEQSIFRFGLTNATYLLLPMLLYTGKYINMQILNFWAGDYVLWAGDANILRADPLSGITTRPIRLSRRMPPFTYRPRSVSRREASVNGKPFHLFGSSIRIQKQSAMWSQPGRAYTRSRYIREEPFRHI